MRSAVIPIRFPFLCVFLFSAPLWAASVVDFGAVPDDGIPDHEAVQKAVDAGGDVYFPPGRYLFGKTVNVNLDVAGYTSLRGSSGTTIEMASAGPAIRFNGSHQGTASPASVKPNVWEKERMPMVDGLAITGSHPEASGIEAIQTMQIILTRLHLRGLHHGIRLAVRNRNVIISNCQVYENSGVGIYLDQINLHQINIGDSHVSYNDEGGIVVRGGNVRNLHIGNCDIEGNMAKDKPATANVFIDAADGSIGEVAITGCTIQHTHDAPESANIRILCGSDWLTKERNVERHHDGNITINGNVLSDVQFNIDIKEARGVAISGNTLWKGYENNIRIVSSSRITLSGNVQDKNPRYGYGDGDTTKNGVLIQDSELIQITGELIDGVRGHPAGLVLRNCKAINVTGCTIHGCEGSGVLIDDCENIRVSDSIILNPAVKEYSAVRLSKARKVKISDNITD